MIFVEEDASELAAVNPNILDNVDLQPLNTLALPARARHFARIETVAQLVDVLRWAGSRQLPLLVLGGGSNVILRGDWPGLALQIALTGKSSERHEDYADVTVAAGESWHELVQWTLQQRLYGLENLTLIPGTAGAAPIQNIGAYGVELAHFLRCVRGIDLDRLARGDASVIEIAVESCQLGYRDSIFKRTLRDRFIITELVLRLPTRFEPILSYPALRDYLREHLRGEAAANASDDETAALQVESAVRAIRRSRLPDPAQLPNAGSFFKNPVIDGARFALLREAHPDIPQFPAASGVKVPAAWLVDRCGWKGRRLGHVGVHAQQALVLIHYGAGSGSELLDLAAAIQADVQAAFGIALELEPTVYGA